MSTILQQLPALIRGLMMAKAFPHACEEIELVETHISWIILTGTFAYKIKKPVDMGFLDFSTLAKRKFYCHEEIRLNSRKAPDTYLSVVPISGSPEQPRIDGDGPAFEFAVKMNQFDQNDMLDKQLSDGRLTAHQVDRLADQIADLHANIDRATPDDAHGTPESIQTWALENFEQLNNLIQNPVRLSRLAKLEDWTKSKFARSRDLMRQRKLDGFVRECHGDLHLGNMTEIDGKIALFDGIEFNEDIRWIDVLNEIAFLFTDLEHRGRADLAWQVLNRYQESTGDYSALRLLRYYRLYRIMVRAKIDALRLGQSGIDESEREDLEADIDKYLDQAERTLQPVAPVLILMRGLSGCGKTHLSQRLLEHIGAIRIRSDIERKRLFQLKATESSESAPGEGLYRPEMSQQTYQTIENLAKAVLLAGYPTLVDATFLKQPLVEQFEKMASELQVAFKVLDIQAPEVVLRERIARRQLDSSEASEAGQDVLTWQLKTYAPLLESYVIAVDSENPPTCDTLAKQIGL